MSHETNIRLFRLLEYSAEKMNPNWERKVENVEKHALVYADYQIQTLYVTLGYRIQISAYCAFWVLLMIRTSSP